MKIIAVVSAKGGVGKTTICSSLSSSLKKSGRRVLAVDLDPQNSLGLHFGVRPKHINGISRAMLSGQSLKEAILKTEGDIFVLPYGLITEDDRESFEKMLRDDPNLLKQKLQALNLGEDCIVVLDTPPGPSVYMQQALNAANAVAVVILADAASYATLPMMTSLIDKYCKKRVDYTDYMVFINQVDRSRQLISDMVDIIKSQLRTKKISVIHQDQAIPESLAYGQNVLYYEPDCQGAHDFLSSAKNLISLLNQLKVRS